MRSLRILVVLLLTALSASAQLGMRTRNPFYLYPRFGVIGNNPDMAAVLKQKLDPTKQRTLDVEYSAAPSLHLGCDIIRLRGAVIGLQATGLYAQPEMLVGGEREKWRAGLGEMYMGQATLFFALNSSGDPYNLFSLPSHSQGESVIGITGAVIQMNEVTPTQRAVDSLGISKINASLSRAFGVYIGWNWRLWDSSWVFGINASLMWETGGKHVEIETSEKSFYRPGTMKFAPRMASAGLGYHF
ncbi:MAG: hypothetical protein KBA16_02515 [Bacteroidia bacterium]|jgi:hypothetical protein|uniref:hypothetical protein n=1 Tax=Candidatus Pollutiaquabacter sp. TaxID=3416354 RepID=UPI001B411E93|nr:hypothetical protein [Bacteroidota bacterium]MBP7268829.1 hypothetical protein [Bacteroidia bacterium]MBP7436570.1 hypothetical protein [Bacteroidia bacterium]MBP7728667.1 hypothetical protein [Bacteroidia bacterium]MBP7772500.1 hypothetical protein [Bacteroidia bacterium]